MAFIMQRLTNISNNSKQKHTILLDSDSSRIVLELCYKPTQLGWFVDITYEKLDFIVRGLRITTNINILNQWRNILPFGLICVGVDNQDPLLLEDFLVGRAILGILSKEEVVQLVELQKDVKGTVNA